MLSSRTLANAEILKPTPRAPRVCIRRGHHGVGVVLAFVLCFAIPTRADLVSGHVYGPNGELLPNRSFTIQETKGQFNTDASGNFTVSLDPGHYTVRPTNDDSLEGSITSYSQPVQQDIHLGKR